MSYVKTSNLIQKFKPRLLTIRPKTSFSKIFLKIKKSKNVDFVILQKANSNQMIAVLFARLIGKKFFWVQNFANPPAPNFLKVLLLTQADRIIVNSPTIAQKLKSQGMEKAKIKIQKEK